MKNSLDFFLNLRTNFTGVFEKVKKVTPKLTKLFSAFSKKASKSFEELKLASTLAFEQMKTKSIELAKNYVKNIGSVRSEIEGLNDSFGNTALGSQALNLLSSKGAVAAMTLAKAFQSANSLDKTMQALNLNTNIGAKEQELLKDAIVAVNKEQKIALNQSGRLAAVLVNAGYTAEEVAANLDTLGMAHRGLQIGSDELIYTFGNLRKSIKINGDQFEEVATQIGVLAKAARNVDTATMSRRFTDFAEGVNRNMQGIAKRTGKSMLELTTEVSEAYAGLSVIGEEKAKGFVDSFIQSVGDDTKIAEMAKLAGNYSKTFQDAVLRGDMDSAMKAVVEGIAENQGKFDNMASVFQDVFNLDKETAQRMVDNKDAIMGINKELEVSRKRFGDLESASENIPTTYQHLMEKFNALEGVLVPLGEALLNLAEVITPVVGAFVNVIAVVADFFNMIPGGNILLVALMGKMMGLERVFISLGKNIIPTKKGLTSFFGSLKNIGSGLLAMWGGITAAIGAAKTALIAFAATTAGTILLPITAVVAALAALWAFFKYVFGIDLIDEYVAYFKWGWGVVIDYFKWGWGLIVDYFKWAWGVVKSVFQKACDAIMWWWDNTIGAMIDGIKYVADLVGDAWDFLFGDEEKNISVNLKKSTQESQIDGPSSVDMGDVAGVRAVNNQSAVTSSESESELVRLQREQLEELKKQNQDRDAKVGESYAMRHRAGSNR